MIEELTPPDEPPGTPTSDPAAPGKDTATILHSTRCRNCGCFFYFDDAHGDFVSDFEKTGRTATCPNCIKPCWVPASAPDQ